MCTHIYTTDTYTYVYMYMWICVFAALFNYIPTYICMYVHTYMFINMCMYNFVIKQSSHQSPHERIWADKALKHIGLLLRANAPNHRVSSPSKGPTQFRTSLVLFGWSHCLELHPWRGWVLKSSPWPPCKEGQGRLPQAHHLPCVCLWSLCVLDSAVVSGWPEGKCCI